MRSAFGIDCWRAIISSCSTWPQSGSLFKKTGREERNFWMRRQGAKIGRRDGKYLRRPNERYNTSENPRRNGLSGAGTGICRFVGLDGGHDRDRTCDPPPNHRTGERKFPTQRQVGKSRLLTLAETA